jgi:hypothetical protein
VCVVERAQLHGFLVTVCVCVVEGAKLCGFVWWIDSDCGFWCGCGLLWILCGGGGSMGLSGFDAGGKLLELCVSCRHWVWVVRMG